MKVISYIVVLLWMSLPVHGQNLLSALDVKHCGAKGDGTTDDSTAVNNCIALLTGSTGNGPGGTLYFSPGTYLLNSCLNIPNDGGTPGSVPPTQPALRLLGSGSMM